MPKWSVVSVVLLWTWIVLLLVVPAVSSRPAFRRRSGSNNRRRVTTNINKQSHPDPDGYLVRFGYLPSYRNSWMPASYHGHPQLNHRTRVLAIKDFQQMAGLTKTGRMDPSTTRKMMSPRCGLIDMVPGGNRMVLYVPDHKWPKTSLTWRAVNYSPDMSTESQRRAFTEAFRQWSDVTPLQFREVSSGDVDIKIKFAGRGEHGDNNPFDGPGMTVAHAFYPESGDTHFDESETWTEGTDEGTNLMIVAAHEFGHALGLGHSKNSQALMSPFYQGYDPSFGLHDDDVKGIQKLYGSKPTAAPELSSRRASPPTPDIPTPSSTSSSDRPDGWTTEFQAVFKGFAIPPPAPPRPPRPEKPDKPTLSPTPSGRPDSYTTKFDAVFQAHDDRIYAFKNKWMWRMNCNGTEKDFPQVTRRNFKKSPFKIAAAVHSWGTNFTYFFKGNKVWTYYGYTFIKKKTITTRGYPRIIQSAFMGRDGRIYLLTGANYYIFDEGRMDVIDISRRTISSKWRGVPANVEAAVRLNNDGYIYFFKGARYRKFSEYYGRVLDGYPKVIAGPWMGSRCTADGRYEPK